MKNWKTRENPNLFSSFSTLIAAVFNLLVELTASPELTLIKNEKWISIIKQIKDLSNNKIYKLESKNKEYQYQCELFMPKHRGLGLGLGLCLDPYLKSTFLNRPLRSPRPATTNFHWSSQRQVSEKSDGGGWETEALKRGFEEREICCRASESEKSLTLTVNSRLGLWLRSSAAVLKSYYYYYFLILVQTENN